MTKKARATQLKTEFLIRSEGGYVLSWRGLQETLLDMSYDRRYLIEKLLRGLLGARKTHKIESKDQVTRVPGASGQVTLVTYSPSTRNSKAS